MPRQSDGPVIGWDGKEIERGMDRPSEVHPRKRSEAVMRPPERIPEHSGLCPMCGDNRVIPPLDQMPGQPRRYVCDECLARQDARAPQIWKEIDILRLLREERIQSRSGALTGDALKADLSRRAVEELRDRFPERMSEH